MIATVVALAASLTALLPLLGWLVYRNDRLARELLSSADLRQKQFEAAEGYIHERDELTKYTAELGDLNRSLKLRLASVQAALEAARGDYANAIAEKIKRGTVADAAHAVDELLQAPFGGKAKTGSGSDGGT